MHRQRGYLKLGPRTNSDTSPRSTKFRLARPRVGPVNPSSPTCSQTKAFNATISTYVATAPPTWEQFQRLILPFTDHPKMNGKTLPLYTPRRALFYLNAPSRHKTTTVMPRVFWGLALSVPHRPPPLRPDRASSTVGQQRSNAGTSTTGDHTPATAPMMFHRPIINITATPRDGQPLPGHVATTTSTVPAEPSSPRHRPRVFCTPRPPLEPIKEEAKGSPIRASRLQATLHFSFSFLRLGTGSLSHNL
jgi:hypothetical protein